MRKFGLVILVVLLAVIAVGCTKRLTEDLPPEELAEVTSGSSIVTTDISTSEAAIVTEFTTSEAVTGEAIDGEERTWKVLPDGTIDWGPIVKDESHNIDPIRDWTLPSGLTSIGDEAKEGYEDRTGVVKPDEGSFAEVISDLHAEMYASVCYDNIHHYIISAMKNAQSIIDMMNVAMQRVEKTDYTDEQKANVKKDLENAKEIYFLSYEFRQEESMKAVHRILHDLDYSFANAGEDEARIVYGYTHTLGGNNASTIDAYREEIRKKVEQFKVKYPKCPIPFQRGAKLHINEVESTVN